MTEADQSAVLHIVTAWSSTTRTELTAARAMYELAKLLGVGVPEPVKGRVRGRPLPP